VFESLGACPAPIQRETLPNTKRTKIDKHEHINNHLFKMGAGLIGIDGSRTHIHQAEGVWNFVNPPCKDATANNVIAKIKNAFSVPAFAPVLA